MESSRLTTFTTHLNLPRLERSLKPCLSLQPMLSSFVVDVTNGSATVSIWLRAMLPLDLDLPTKKLSVNSLCTRVATETLRGFRSLINGVLKDAFERWLEQSNFDENGQQKLKFSKRTAPFVRKTT
ncbi:LOW QUALITY PROTEIN: hypothetical protein PHMEG_00025571 [Phytophthora megakarya]|uniref:Uncharacterized protein n=1 Tax=Phytophthora megakarya TaxID=4795 RepID=A0A225VBR3_9STRA|nr:LOW QUALITY PROTEIN: hypothetical protein PHMEG_00025571 [Phytophthora megakarya]